MAKKIEFTGAIKMELYESDEKENNVVIIYSDVQPKDRCVLIGEDAVEFMNKFNGICEVFLQ